MEPAKSVEQSHRERQDLYKKLWAENPSLYMVWGIVIGLLIAAVIGGNESVWDVLVSFAPEFVGLLFVTLVLDRRAEYRERERHKQQLIRDMGGSSNEFARRAVNELRHEGWLTDGTLQGERLGWANLQGTDLRQANLQGVTLRNANLQNADLEQVNLEGADLRQANLRGAKLWGANLQAVDLGQAKLQGAALGNANLQDAELGNTNLQDAKLAGANLQGAKLLFANLQSAILWTANLQGADLAQAKLQGASLEWANLQGAEFSDSAFDEKTQLPDSTHYDPQQGPEQLERFTNPSHPAFWHSKLLDTLAFRGDLETPATHEC